MSYEPLSSAHFDRGLLTIIGMNFCSPDPSVVIRIWQVLTYFLYKAHDYRQQKRKYYVAVIGTIGNN